MLFVPVVDAQQNPLQAWRKAGQQDEYKKLMRTLKAGPEYGLSGC
jgi:hypothetical protein